MGRLDKAVEYYEKLKPTCVDSGITYEERVKRREEETRSIQGDPDPNKSVECNKLCQKPTQGQNWT